MCSFRCDGLIISLFIKIDFDAVHNNTDAKIAKGIRLQYTQLHLQKGSTSINSYDGYCTKLCFNTDFLEIFAEQRHLLEASVTSFVTPSLLWLRQLRE